MRSVIFLINLLCICMYVFTFEVTQRIVITVRHVADRRTDGRIDKVSVAVQTLQDAMLSQGEPRDVAISFDTTASCMRLLWYRMCYLYRPTSATVQMLG